MRKLYKEMVKRNPEYLPRPFDEIYKLLGFEGLKILIEFFGGTRAYIPGHKTMFAECIRINLMREYNSSNYRELCRKYGISASTLYRYVGQPWPEERIVHMP